MKTLGIVLLMGLLTFQSFGQVKVRRGAQADKLINGAKLVRDGHHGVASYVRFAQGQELPLHKLDSWLVNVLKVSGSFTFTVLNEMKTVDGVVHTRYQQRFMGVPIHGAVLLVHHRGGLITAVNGDMWANAPSSVAAVSSPQALQYAKQEVNAEVYKWEVAGEEAHLKWEKEDANASYLPTPLLSYYGSATGLKLAYEVDIYAQKPLSRASVFIDAQTGRVLGKLDHIHTGDAHGTATTAYSGAQNIVTDSLAVDNYVLQESGRGNGVRTLNMLEGTSYNGAVDFEDDDNDWNNVNAQLDQFATDAHWGAEMTYDYFFQKHNRNSIDGNGFRLDSYIHYDVAYNNAFWDGNRMTYGDGNGYPLTTVDIAGHEITHGLTDFTANLVYQDESGALNESFSDVFGVSIEWFAKPAQANWLMGDETGGAFRSMQNPNQYGDPKTYEGDYWYTGTDDNGGVHTNSGVQNFWYYLLVNGGSGQNELFDFYSVQALGLDVASAIAFRSLTTYLTAYSNYSEARFYSIQSAIDLYGECSYEVEQVTRAWFAVNVGPNWSPGANSDFSASVTSSCSAPFQVDFENLSVNGLSFEWSFGDGSTSTELNPSHVYTALGTYDVSLAIEGGTCGQDTLIQVEYVDIDSTNLCVVMVGAANQTACEGTIYDDGGSANNYTDNSNHSTTISPTGASGVGFEFTMLSIEAGSSGNCDYDYVELYDGVDTNAPLIGRYCDDTGMPGVVAAASGSLTIVQYADGGVNQAGFEGSWFCFDETTGPLAQFNADMLNACNGEVSFLDNSVNNPTSWLWSFGDGQVSTLQNPTHVYAMNGSYDVTLEVSNSNGSHESVQVGYVTISKPAGPAGTNDSICPGETPNLSVINNGNELNWYADQTSTSVLATGGVFSPAVVTTTSFYVEEVVDPPVAYGGPFDNSFAAGGMFNGDQHLIFNVSSPTKLVAVKVFADGAANRVFELRDNLGQIIKDSTVFVIDGEARIVLNWDLPAMDGLQLGTADGPQDLFRNSEGANYPYQVGSNVVITGSSANGNNAQSYYYFFYNWEIDDPACMSERTEVTAVVRGDGSFEVEGEDVLCSGQSTVLNVPGTGYTGYVWSTGETTASITVSPSADETYLVSVTGGCGDGSAQLTVQVGNYAPTVAVIGDEEMCEGGVANLTATGTSVDSYLWSTGEQTASIVLTGGATASVTATNDCGSASTNVVLTVNDGPTAGFNSSVTGIVVTFDNTSTNADSYRWDFGDGTIVYTSTATHAFTGGSHEVMLIAYNDCGSDTTYQTIDVVSAVAERSIDSNISFYPNPAQDKVIVEVAKPGVVLEVTDVLGKVVKRVALNKLKTTVSVDDLASGLYHLVFVGEVKVVRPLVVK